MMSPFLFIFYLNELLKQANSNDCKGIYIDEDHPNVSMLLYADDLVLLGDNIGRVQHLLDNLSLFCTKWGLMVNMEKTKFMVFRNGGIVKGNEKVYFNGIRISTASYYKYLGVLISSRLCWSPAQVTLSQQAGKAMNYIYKINKELDFSFVTSNEIFDKCIVPVSIYGCEVWGMKVYQCVENNLVKFCRHQLGVGSKAPIPAILGECGRKRMYVLCYTKCIKYWLKLIKLREGSLLKSCYNLAYNQCQAGRCNWAKDVKNILYSFGFGFVWDRQNVENEKVFLDEFTIRLSDCDTQLWNNSMSQMPKLRTLRLFKKEFVPEPYLFLLIPQRLRSAWARFTIGCHDLEIERGRHTSIPANERFCKLCISVHSMCIEDEYHVLLHCPFYNDLRRIYLNTEHSPLNLYTFISMMSSDGNALIRLCTFIAQMFKLRKILLLSL